MAKSSRDPQLLSVWCLLPEGAVAISRLHLHATTIYQRPFR